VLETNLDVVAITEHNDVTWLDLLRGAPGAGAIVIFPGFEVASAEGVHVLCLWEPDSAAPLLDEALTEVGLPSHRRWHDDGTPRMSRLSLEDLASFVHDRGGLCVLSHVDREDGVLHRLKGEPRTRAWLESGALAVQCSKNPRLMDPSSFYRRALTNEGGQYHRDRPDACIQTSDARSLAEIGSKPTFIKISSNSIEGLRQAFLDPDSRVRFPDEHEVRSYPKIIAVRWDGCFLDAGVPLNSNLNCLIGGKGTAKSTVVETIRHAFTLPIESEGVREQATALLDETFPSSAKISLLVEVAKPRPARYLIERTGRDLPLVRSADTEEILDGVQPSGLFHPIIFGQKEIYETASRLESQLNLLDRYCASELEPLGAREATVAADIHALSERIRRVSADAASVADRLAELPVLRERKRLFDEAGLADKLAEQRQLERERALIKAVEQRLDEHEGVLSELKDTTSGEIGGVAELGETPNADLITDARAVLERVEGAWSQLVKDVEAAVTAARTRLDEIRTAWQLRFDEKRADFDRAVGEVAGEHGESNIRGYLQLDGKIDQLTILKGEQDARKRTLSGSRRQRKELVADLREVRRQIFLIRERKAEELTRELVGAVRLTVEHQANRERVLASLKSLKSGAGQRQLQQLVERQDFSPARLAELLRSGSDALIRDYKVPDGVAQQLARAATDEAIDRLETLALEDLVEIALNVGGNGRVEFRPLERLSAGQRSTAILLLALLESDGPLILNLKTTSTTGSSTTTWCRGFAPPRNSGNS
jgi:hypothetical protein